MIKNSIVSQGGVRREEEIQVRWNKSWNLLTTCFQCQEKIISSSSSPVKSLTPILTRFSESELLLLHRLVHQECDEGVLSEKKIRNVYADIFPVVFNVFLNSQLEKWRNAESCYHSGRGEELCWSRVQDVGQGGPRVRETTVRTFQQTLYLSFTVSFVFCNEFVEFLCVTARGSPRQRSDLVFRLCDLDRSGGVTFKHLNTVLKSIGQLGKATID